MFWYYGHLCIVARTADPEPGLNIQVRLLFYFGKHMKHGRGSERRNPPEA